MSDQGSLFGLPDPDEDRPLPFRHDHPKTSRDAAARARPNAKSQRGRLLVLMHDAAYGLTAFEAWRELVRTNPTVRVHIVSTRMCELRDQGWIVLDHDMTGEPITRPTDTGSPAQVFVFNPEPGAHADYRDWRDREEKRRAEEER
jgi:hypothetical protein